MTSSNSSCQRDSTFFFNLRIQLFWGMGETDMKRNPSFKGKGERVFLSPRNSSQRMAAY